MWDFVINYISLLKYIKDNENQNQFTLVIYLTEALYFIAYVLYFSFKQLIKLQTLIVHVDIYLEISYTEY